MVTGPLQSSAPIFAKSPQQERTQFCTTLPLTCDEDLFRDSRVYSWQLVCVQKKSLASFQILHAAMYQILRGAAILLGLLSTPEDLESRKLPVEIKQQRGVIDLSGPAVASTNVGTATEFLAEGWSTESVSRVARSARTKQGNSGQECAEQAFCMYMQQDMPAFHVFPATRHGQDEEEPSTERTENEDGQDDEKEQSLADTLPVRRQVARIHENMCHPSNHTLVRVLWLDGSKRRLVSEAARHRCGACEAQKRPAGQIVTRSPSSFVFNDVVGLDMFFSNTYEIYTLPAMNLVRWGTGLQRVVLYPLEISRDKHCEMHIETRGCDLMADSAFLLLTNGAAHAQRF